MFVKYLYIFTLQSYSKTSNQTLKEKEGKS